jgi:hypothetical protein
MKANNLSTAMFSISVLKAAAGRALVCREIQPYPTTSALLADHRGSGGVSLRL